MFFMVPAPNDQSDSYGRRKSAAAEYRRPAIAGTAAAANTGRAAARDPAGSELRAAEERPA
jgi:hypothetical protein